MSAAALNDRDVAELVNQLRDIAMQHGASQSLRERIAEVVLPHMRRARDLERLAYEDPLTGLANRRRFDERLAEGRDSALLLIDLDDFKRVNDTLGHEAGDRLLQAVAGRLRAGVSRVDLVARLGGDEFAVLLADRGKRTPSPELVAMRLLRSLAGEVRLSGSVTVCAKASIGISAVAGPGHSQTALSLADRAMYISKAHGGMRWSSL